MLLGFIAGILNKYIGTYFEDIDVSHLSGSIFGGQVTLEDIHLRPSIFESLGIPFHVVGGKCGKLEINYSLTQSGPVVATLKDLHVLIIPAHGYRGVESNEGDEEAAMQHEKMHQLEIFDSIKHHVMLAQQGKSMKFKMKTFPTPTQPPEDESIMAGVVSSFTNNAPEATYFDMWVMQVLRNIVVHIESVHIRFEDDLTKPLEPFAVGLFFQSIEVHTTNSDWKDQYIKGYSPETSYKLVKVTNFSVYWNPAPTTLYKAASSKKTLFHQLAHIPGKEDDEFNIFFEPLSTDLKVQVTPFPDTIQDPFTKPQILVENSLNEVSIKVSDRQFKDIIPFLKTLDVLMKSHKYRKYRTDLNHTPYYGHYLEWWKFAYKCVLDDIQRRRKNFRWSHILEHRQKCREYLKAYYKKKGENTTTPAIELTISNLEQELDLFNLIILRQQVDILISRHIHQPEQLSEGKTYVEWLTSWFSYSYWFPLGAEVVSNSPLPPIDDDKVFSTLSLTQHEKEIIRVAVEFADNIDIINYHVDDYIYVEANVLLNKLYGKIYRVLEKYLETVLKGVSEKAVNN